MAAWLARALLAVLVASPGCLARPIDDPCGWHPDSITAFAVSPDGGTLAVAYVGDGPYAALYVVDLANGTPARLLLERPEADLSSPTFFQHGERVAFVETAYTARSRGASGLDVRAASAVRTVPVDGGPPQTLLDAGGFVHSAVTDGHTVYVSRAGPHAPGCTFGGGDLVAVPFGGGAAETLRQGTGPRLDSLGLTDDGATLVFQEGGGEPGATVQRLDVAAGRTDVLVRSEEPADFQPCAAADGSVVVTREGAGRWQPWSWDTMGTARQVADVPGGAYAACLAMGGSELVFLQEGRLMAMTLPDGPLRVVFRLA